MRVFAIGDLHLSRTVADKAMDVFGPAWRDHAVRIAENWKETVEAEDAVLIPGDISWAMRLQDAKADLCDIGRLPGRKILVRGNHDYWWSAPAKVRSVLPHDMQIIQNDAVRLGDTVFCGCRGWVFPMGTDLCAHDQKIFEREKLRLRMSLERARQLNGHTIVVLMHYPPLYESCLDTDFTHILEEFGVSHVVFGHLHGKVLQQINMKDFRHNGITYNLVSADYVGFAPAKILDTALER